MIDFSAETKQTIRDNIVFCFLLFFKFFVYDISMVPSCSMTPTFLTGDLVLVNKHCIRWSMLSIPYGGVLRFGKKGYVFKIPDHGTPCVFTLPGDPFTYYLKRLVGKEGDWVQMKNGVLHINDEPVKMKFVKNYDLLTDDNKIENGQIWNITLKNGKSYNVYRNRPLGEGPHDNTPKYQVPKGFVWVQGDYHANSLDCFSGLVKGTRALPVDHLIATPVYVIINSKSRENVNGLILWIAMLPYLIPKYIYKINWSRKFFVADKV
ncbi:signal peptidase I [Alphaproteobacteria bacterium endosymbiont of Tiliacea citrago]|uniref:signal peptidase I n=1 Tax=Alphaproteobacteria bacterium endosymbiont of Tiliacea citrago TaxID=3077944 RepID=UPI00313F1CD8